MNKVNPHFRSKYADLAAVRDVVLPPFTRHGLSILQVPTISDEHGFHLETRISHSSGEYLIWRFPLPADFSKMQSIGSAISYARRYTLSAIGAVASEEDDDGNAAQTPPNGGGFSTRSNPPGTVTAAGGNASKPDGGIVL